MVPRHRADGPAGPPQRAELRDHGAAVGPALSPGTAAQDRPRPGDGHGRTEGPQRQHHPGPVAHTRAPIHAPPIARRTTTRNLATSGRWGLRLPASSRRSPRGWLIEAPTSPTLTSNAARGLQLPRRSHPAEDRRRVPALHPAPARDRVSALPRADAGYADRRFQPSAGDPALAEASSCRAAARCAADPAGRADRLPVPHGPRRDAVADRAGGSARTSASRATCRWASRDWRRVRSGLRIGLHAHPGLDFSASAATARFLHQWRRRPLGPLYELIHRIASACWC